MTPQQALERAVSLTGHERFRDLVDPSSPDYNPSYWGVIYRTAGTYPSVVSQLKNAAHALYDSVKTGFANVSSTEHERRMSICRACEWFESEDARCVKCGCYMSLKSLLASQHCPIEKW
jgi:hypothetical protein